MTEKYPAYAKTVFLRELVSIIIPVYMAEEKILRECLESVKNQTYRKIEVIMIDDGSPDGSGMICEKYSALDERFRVWHTENAGVSNARNTGLEKSSGEYVFFLDADDRIAEDCIEILLRILQEKNADCVKGAVWYLKEKEKSSSLPTDPGRTVLLEQAHAVEALCYMKPPLPDVEMTAVWGCLYRRETIGNIRFEKNTPVGEDFAFNYRVFSGIRKMAVSGIRLYYYRILPTSVMRNGFKAEKHKILDVMDNMIEEESCRQFRDALKVRYVNMAFVLLMMVPPGRGFSVYRKNLMERIKKYRREALRNEKTKTKVRAALLLSYLGPAAVQKIFRLISGNPA